MTQKTENIAYTDVVCQPAEKTFTAISSIASGETVIIDFDETLFLHNSTEEYLNSLQPRFLGALLLFALSFLKPWNWLMPKPYRGEVSRDWFRVILATILFPWTPFLWQRKAKKYSLDWCNKSLFSALASMTESPIIIASNGFEFIIAPVIQHWDLPVDQVIACRFWRGVSDRFTGKLALVTDALGQDTLKNALVITDSEDDLPLLRSVGKPCLTRWPEARYRRAMGDIYFPFFYTEKVKQLNRNYLTKVILAEDLVFLMLCTSWLSPNPVLHGISMAFLMTAFWCVYEVGYMENDLVAEQLESTPTLAQTYLDNKDRINLIQPWYWAVLFSIPGVLLLQAAQFPLAWSLKPLVESFQNLDWLAAIADTAKWMAFLLLVRFTFWVYNYVNKPTRIWLYPLLQVYKCFGFLVLATTNLIGSMFFAAQTLSRWICYFVYRYSKGSWYKVGQILRCVIFALLVVAVAFGLNDFSLLASWQLGVIFTYVVIKSIREMKLVIKDFGMINDPSKS